MDRDILTNILNRLEDKVDIISTGLTNNTSVTQSHTKMLSEMKGIHDVSAQVILETRDQIKDLKNEVFKINSWKDGQINYQQQVLKDVKNLQDIVDPMHKEYLARNKKKEQIDSEYSKIGWGMLEKLTILVAGAILISLPSIIKIVYANILK